jgi:hypothetical protein
MAVSFVKFLLMDFDDELRRYREGVFTDDDITRCTGLSQRAWRELIKLEAVRTVTQRRGPGRVRLCDTKTFKRAAVIAAIHSAGLSLATAGRLAYFLPREELLFAICDPFTILFVSATPDDPRTGLPPRLKTPKADWFDRNAAAKTDPSDWLVEIYDNRFVGVLYRLAGAPDLEPDIYADLGDEGTTVTAWRPLHGPRQVFDVKLRGVVEKFSAKWDEPDAPADQLDPGFLNYRYENHDAEKDPLRLAAQAAVGAPVCKSTINVTLAVRKALRRYLGIEPAMPSSNMGATK